MECLHGGPLGNLLHPFLVLWGYDAPLSRYLYFVSVGRHVDGAFLILMFDSPSSVIWYKLSVGLLQHNRTKADRCSNAVTRSVSR
jgi:hypothetical protein